MIFQTSRLVEYRLVPWRASDISQAMTFLDVNLQNPQNSLQKLIPVESTELEPHPIRQHLHFFSPTHGAFLCIFPWNDNQCLVPWQFRCRPLSDSCGTGRWYAQGTVMRWSTGTFPRLRDARLWQKAPISTDIKIFQDLSRYFNTTSTWIPMDSYWKWWDLYARIHPSHSYAIPYGTFGQRWRSTSSAGSPICRLPSWKCWNHP